MKKVAIVLGIALFALSPFFVYGQLLDPVDYSLTATPDSVKAGEVFNVSVEAEIEGEWHLYSILNDPDAGPYPTRFSSASTNMAIAGDVEESEAVIAFDPNFNTDLGWHSESAQFTIPIAFRSSLQGVQPIELEVLYQVCDDRSCLPPKTKIIEGEVVLAGVAENAFQNFPEEAATALTEESDDFELTSSAGISSDSVWGFLWLAITAGFAALLTPCVFPLIPLTVSYFSNQAEENQRPVGLKRFCSVYLSL